MRLTLRRVTAVAMVTGASVLGVAQPAFADPGWGSVDCSETPSPACELGAGTGNGTPGGTVEPGGAGADRPDPGSGGQADPANPAPATCGYRPSGYRPPPGAAGSGAVPNGMWLDGLCSATGVIETPVYAALTPADIAQLARSQLRLPAPAVVASPASDQLVNLPTWLWLSSAWEPISATASVPGVSVTATAVPMSATWSMGDGGMVTCSGPGTPFPTGSDPKSTSPDCGYIYRTSSAGQRDETFQVTAAVTWTVTWAGAGESGIFPNMRTSASAAFRVAESQAVTTG
jgi:hypothetical protein